MTNERSYIFRQLLRQYADFPTLSFANDNELINLAKIRKESLEKPMIYVGMGSCGQIAGARETEQALIDYLKLHEIEAELHRVGCLGICSQEPLVDVQLPGKARICFSKVTPDLVPDILGAIFSNNIPIEHTLGQYRTTYAEPWPKVPYWDEHRFFKKQKRIILEHCGVLVPDDIEQFIVHGGYLSFVKAILSYRPEQICDLIERVNLRGRGGSGFPTAIKWRTALNTAGEQKFLICNADESDPGAFMGRTLLEGSPHKVIEGMAIAAYAIGATKAILFVRKEYSNAIDSFNAALKQARTYGLLGSDILGSGFDLTISIRISPGAFVCGEETALISSIEGRRGMPRNKPPYPAVQGLFGMPTVVNNLETLALVPTILSRDGLESEFNNSVHFPATKVIALAGKSVNQGIAEIPLGISLREIIYGIGGGIRDEKAFKSAHLSGPTGYSLGPESMDLAYDFDRYEEHGASIGSGGITVLDENDCMLDLAKYFMCFLVKESCGKCIPCREGTSRMAEILEDITRRPRHESGHETLERFKGVMQLEDLAAVIRDTSLCGLGRNASNAILSSLSLFREEYEEHIFERKCKAGVCTHLRTYAIDIDKCTGCALCARKCPEAAIIGTPNFPHFIVEEKCTGCGICFETCKFVAINII